MEQKKPVREILLDGIYDKYGYDFRQYSPDALNRRISSIITKHHKKDENDLLSSILAEPPFFKKVLCDFTITTSELFRDPLFFLAFRQKVLPVLRTYPTLNFWIAGCSTGEEIYSLAILLQEEGLYDRSVIHATDINPKALKAAKDGIYNLESIRHFTKNYVTAGGHGSPSDYYTVDYDLARFRPSLRENVVFSEHNLVNDAVFIEAHMIFCRNVLIYFNPELQKRVFGLFHDSLISRGFLGLGSRETVRFSAYEQHFDRIDKERIFQKNRVLKGDGRIGED